MKVPEKSGFPKKLIFGAGHPEKGVFQSHIQPWPQV